MRPARHDAHLGNEIHVSEGASTEADEPLGIEPSFEIFQAVIDRVAVALDRFEMQELAFGDNRRDLRHRDDDHLAPAANGNALDVARSRHRVIGVNRCPDARALIGSHLVPFDALVGAGERLAQAPLVDRFEQVIDRVHLERTHRVLVKGGHERDQRQVALLQHAHDTDSIELRHLQVEQREIRGLALDDRHRLLAGSRFTDHDDILAGPQQRHQKCPRRTFVIRDHHPQPRRHLLHLALLTCRRDR